MAHQISTQTKIEATAAEVWKVLTDFENYAEWNPFIKSIKGMVKPGKTIEAQIDNMRISPQVLVFKQNEEFKWLGHLFIKGLFDGEHRFQLIANADGSTTFIHSERFRGILIPFFKKMINGKVRDGFVAMNLALKARVEG